MNFCSHLKRAALPRRIALIASLMMPLLGAAQASAQQATVLDGVYSAQQATRGKDAYYNYCEECHMPDLEGGALEPPLIADPFLNAWREDYLWSLYDFTATRMPKSKEFHPGSLQQQEYLDILAYILQRNDFPAGAKELTEPDLHKVLLVGPKGPQPLPPNASMRTVGCLKAADGGYRLERSAAPSRVHTADETDQTELGRSATQALGKAVFALNNLDTLGKPLAKLAGRKVQVKGVLNDLGQPNARIFALSLEDVGSCAP